MARVTGVVLAAGSGTRMGTPKAELLLSGHRLLDLAVTTLSEAGCTPVLAVVRPNTTLTGARAVVNDDPDRGMRSSLALAIEATAIQADATDAVAVILVDTPGIGPDAIRTVVTAWRPGRIAVATYGGRRSHPTVMPRALWQEALGLAGPDEGAKNYLKARSELVDEVPVNGDPTDLDTSEELHRWRREIS